jgi:peroxiredoxin
MYKNDAADVVAISVDSIFTLGKFKEEQNLPFDLLSDFNREAATAYDALHEVFPAFAMERVAKRAAFVVDKNGIIQYAQVLESPGDLPDFAAINATLSTLN